MMLCLSEHFLMSLPQASAEAIFEIYREIATAKPPSGIMDCSITCRKQFETLHPGISPQWVKDMMVNFGIQRPQPSLRPTVTKGLLSERSDGSRQDQIPRPRPGWADGARPCR